MKLPAAADRYDRTTQQRTFSAIEQADSLNRKKGADVELANERLILKSPNGQRWKISVSDVGVISASAV